MNKTIGVLAHVDAGKTTFSEQLLYHNNVIRERGRVDHKDTFLDTHEIEKRRGITVFSDQAIMKTDKGTYYWIDTPGHVDFSAEMERTIGIMDYAVVILSAVEGIESHSETVFSLLKKHKVPTFFFINKIDRTGADVENVIAEIRSNFTEDACPMPNSIHSFDEQLIEFVAERDEALLDRYMDEQYDYEVWLDALKKMIKESKVYPIAWGSALKDIDIASFWDTFEDLTYTDYDSEGEFAGRVYKIKHDKNGVRYTYIKALEGELKIRDNLFYSIGDKELVSKITQIKQYNGSKATIVERVVAGDLFAVTGLADVSVGDGVGALKTGMEYQLVPSLQSKVIFDDAMNPKDVLRDFRIMETEDPALGVTWVESSKELQVRIMGVIQIEILKEIVKDRFGYEVEFGDSEIIYKETINDGVIGYGHFEPLRHYAEVHLKIEKGSLGSGIQFDNQCHADHMTIGNQNLVKHHIFEREHRGILTGSSLTDLKITLLTGAGHNEYTSGGDFREATYRALRQGLEKAENVVLEPYYEFKIKVSLDHMGRVMTDIQKASGKAEPPVIMGDRVEIEGRVPVSTFMSYSTTLTSFTQGKGRLSLIYGGYDVCHNQEEVVERKGYDKNGDAEYSSSSVFCSKGKGDTVLWDEAEAKMHCL